MWTEGARGAWDRAEPPTALPVCRTIRTAAACTALSYFLHGVHSRASRSKSPTSGQPSPLWMPGDRQQADQCLMHGGLHRIGKRARYVDERSDLFWRIQIRCRMGGADRSRPGGTT